MLAAVKPGCATAGPGAAGTHLSADGAARAACWYAPGIPRPVATWRAWRVFTQFGDRRDPQRGRQHGAPPLIWRSFAAAHNLKIGTIADLIQYRIKNEKTVERVTSCNLPTRRGDFQLVAYQDVIGNEMHLALVKGEISPDRPTLVRVRAEHAVRPFESARDCGWPLRRVMDQVSSEARA